MQGILIVNHYLTGEKYTSQSELYLAAAARQGVSLTVRSNAERIPSDTDFVLFLDKDIRLARLLELDGYRVFNSANSIALCDDKSMTYLHLRNRRIPMPETLIVPKIFFPAEWEGNPFVENAEDTLGYPMIAKACFGSFGQQVWLVQSRKQLLETLDAHAVDGMLLQKFISSSYGRDIRINVVDGEPIACMYRWSDTDFRANISAGGNMKPYTPNALQNELAVRVCRELGLTFGGVDLLFGADGEPILCEVNSNAHIRNILDCTGINVAEAILSHIRLRLEAWI